MAKLTSDCASATLKFWPCWSFWPIIGVAPSRCQICRVLSLMPYCGYTVASCLAVAFSASSAACPMLVPVGSEV